MFYQSSPFMPLSFGFHSAHAACSYMAVLKGVYLRAHPLRAVRHITPCGRLRRIANTYFVILCWSDLLQWLSFFHSEALAPTGRPIPEGWVVLGLQASSFCLAQVRLQWRGQIRDRTQYPFLHMTRYP